jgi:hypothetical protein
MLALRGTCVYLYAERAEPSLQTAAPERAYPLGMVLSACRGLRHAMFWQQFIHIYVEFILGCDNFK